MQKVLLCLLLSIFSNTINAQKFSILKDIQPGIESSYPGSLTLINNKLYFSAEDSLHGDELWISEGTKNNTNILLDLNPGKASSNPQNLIYFNGSLYFTADDGVNGNELWRLKLSNMNLHRLTTTTVSSPFWGPDGFIVYQNELYFSFDDGVHGSEVWKTNGTVAGTVLVNDINAGATGTGPRKFFIFKNKLFFLGQDEIDTQALYVINSNGSEKRFFNCGEEGCSAFTTLNNAFYFFSDDQVFSHPDKELYTSNGSIGGTHIVKQINPNGVGTYFDMTSSGGELFFAADDSVHGIELWKSDGTAKGTQLVKDINPGSNGSTPDYFIPYHNKVIFQAYKNNNGGAWISDGTAAGTIKLADILVNTQDERNYTIANNKLFFVGYVKNYGYELCVSDGTPAGTKLKLDINKGIGTSSPYDFTPWDSTLFFVADDDVKGYEVCELSPLTFIDSPSANNMEEAVLTNQKAALEQNSPNPFSNTTNIQYVLPDTYVNANLIFRELSGRVVKSIPLSGSGIQNLNVEVTNLSAGIYFYSLVIDDKTVVIKKCIISK